jgi:hypothetical protein
MSSLGINWEAQGCSVMMDLEGAEDHGQTELSAGIKQLVGGSSFALMEADIRTGRLGLCQCKSSHWHELLHLSSMSIQV